MGEQGRRGEKLRAVRGSQSWTALPHRVIASSHPQFARHPGLNIHTQ
ncbi:hypothetical protein [Dendronalium sp. ChiSLP03b]|nr:hypothetical protein [Dendronalium sp. ChiSLP03b]